MMGPDGALYVTTSNGGTGDRILRITANTPPPPPSITSLTRGDRTLAVVWTAPANTGGGVITAYDVRYIETSEDETDDANWTVRDNAWRSGDLRYVISSLTNATQYDVQVRAVNSAGDGEWSDTETGTPLPDDIPITLQWEETSIEVAEDAGSVVLRAVFTTTLDSPPEADFTFDVTLTTTDTSTTKGDDHTAPPASATFVASDFSQTDVNGQQRYRATRDFTVVILDDTVDESDEVLRVTLAYSTPGLTHLKGGPATAVVTIQDNEHVPVTLSWEQSDVTVVEGTWTATLRAYAITTVDKQPEDGFAFEASISTSDGSAVQPGDYTQVNDTVTFSRNDFSRATVNGERRYRAVKLVQAPIVDDTSDEDEEDFTATIDYANPGPIHLQGGSATTSVKITDNDFVPVTISWDQSSVSVDEDATTVTLQARATTTSDKMPESGITVALSATSAGRTATEGSDYRRLTNSFSFRQGDFTRTDVGGQFRFQATRDVSVSIREDTVNEPDENFTVTLSYSNPSLPHLQGDPDTATVTIADNDHVPVTLGWEETAVTAEEPTSPGTTTPVILSAMAVTATDKRPESGFTFDFTVNTANGTARQPDDYEQLTATETFDRNDFFQRTVNGQSRWVASADFTVNVEHDTVDEPLERFTVRLAFVGSRQPHLTLGDSTATVTTTDDGASLGNLLTTVSARTSVAPGEQLTYDWSVSNSGPSASTNTVLTTTLDAGTSYVSDLVTSPATGQCRQSGRTVTCTFGTLELGNTASGEIVVNVQDNASADIRFTATARADQLDRTPADNDDSVTTELYAPPRKITNLRASGASAHIDLTWSMPGDNGSPITRYELERKETGGSYALVGPGPGVAATTYRDSQVTTGMTYTYQLRAFNIDGDAEWSNEATAIARVTRPPPPPPRTGGGGGGGGGAPLNRSAEFTDGSMTDRSIAENTPAGTDIGEPVAATDREDDTLTYSLRGTDAESFDIDPATGQLLTKAPLDYEAQAAYSVIVSVSDGKSSSGRDSDARDDSIAVTINVENVDEPGAVALSSHQPQVAVALTATLTDLDGGLVGVAWLWERSSDQADWAEIDGAVSDVYTPVIGDLSSYLRITASYEDGHGRDKSAGAVTGDPVLINTVPRFPGADADRGIAIEVEEGSGDAESGGAGEPVAAADPDGDTLTYSLGGDDAGSFEIDASTGQLWSNAPLDYETQAAYSLVVSVRDGRDFNGDPDTAVDASVTVTIAVVNVGEPGTLTLLSSQPRIGVPLAARLTDPDGVVGEVVWKWERSRDGNPWSSSWRTISGAEANAYAAVDADLGYYLRVTASYEDGHGPDKTRQAISGAPVEENTGPVFSDAPDGVFERSVAENTAEGGVVGDPVAAASPSGGALTYTLGGADAALFAIDAGTGQIRVGAGTVLDYEADRNVYEVTVIATDSSGASATVAVTITVTNVDLPGMANDYDADKNEAIDRDEALAAVVDYFSGGITQEEAIEVVRLYFAG